MVNDLDVTKVTKKKLKQTLKKYPTLFGGGLGTLDMKPVEIELMPNAKPYVRKFYNVPKAYEDMAKTEVNRLYTVDVLEKLSHTTDSPWAAPSFCQTKKQVMPNFLLTSEK